MIHITSVSSDINTSTFYLTIIDMEREKKIKNFNTLKKLSLTFFIIQTIFLVIGFIRTEHISWIILPQVILWGSLYLYFKRKYRNEIYEHMKETFDTTITMNNQE